MVELPLEEEDFGDFGNEGLFTDSFTPLESITDDLLSDKGHIANICFGNHPKEAVDYNMILTLPVEFKAQQD